MRQAHVTPVRTTHAGSEIHNRLHRNRGEGRSCGSNLHPVHNVRNEIGLSDGYAEALGEYIGTQAASLPANACGVMVVTHSRRLAEGLVRGLGADPAMLAMLPDAQSTPPTVSAWISSREVRSVDDLMGLKDVALERFRAVHRILEGKE
jgi:hypothetical protein